MARPAIVIALLAQGLCLQGCRSGPVQRIGPPQAKIIRRAYSVPVARLREAVLQSFGATSSRPFPFSGLKANELKPPMYSPDWVEGFADPGGFLKPYKQIPAAERQHDLIVRDATGDLYWNSEYAGANGPVKFRCDFILHFAEIPGGTEAQVFEQVPVVWPGMYWTFGHAGPGRYRDIRLVEPTVRDRVAVLDLVDAILRRAPEH